MTGHTVGGRPPNGGSYIPIDTIEIVTRNQGPCIINYSTKHNHPLLVTVLHLPSTVYLLGKVPGVRIELNLGITRDFAS